MNNRMKCDSCGSKNMRRLSQVVEQGTRDVTSTGPRYTVHHRSQNELAARHDPRTNWRSPLDTYEAFGLAAVLITTGGLVSEASLWVSALSWYVRLPLLALAGAGAAVLLYGVARIAFPGYFDFRRALRRLHEQELADFDKAWLCMQCGNKQVQE